MTNSDAREIVARATASLPASRVVRGSINMVPSVDRPTIKWPAAAGARSNRARLATYEVEEAADDDIDDDNGDDDYDEDDIDDDDIDDDDNDDDDDDDD